MAVLAAILFVVAWNMGEWIEAGRPRILQDKRFPPYVAVFRIHGPFLFGATDKIQPILDGIADLSPIVIIRLRNMTAIDATGLHALEDLADRCMPPAAR